MLRPKPTPMQPENVLIPKDVSEVPGKKRQAFYHSMGLGQHAFNWLQLGSDSIFPIHSGSGAFLCISWNTAELHHYGYCGTPSLWSCGYCRTPSLWSTSGLRSTLASSWITTRIHRTKLTGLDAVMWIWEQASRSVNRRSGNIFWYDAALRRGEPHDPVRWSFIRFNEAPDEC